MNEEQSTRAKELAIAHWGYIKALLEAHRVSDDAIDTAEFHYQSAFVHGYKHAIEDVQATPFQS